MKTLEQKLHSKSIKKPNWIIYNFLGRLWQFTVARKYKLEPKKMQFVYPNIKSAPSIVLVEYSYFGGNELKVLPPLIEYDDKNNYTKQIYDIYGSEKNGK